MKNVSRHNRIRLDAFDRGLGRHHVAAAVLAVMVSLILHAVLLLRIDSLPIRAASTWVERPRFVPIEMIEVRREPPPREEHIDRPPLDRPGVEMPTEELDDAMWAEWVPPAPAQTWPEMPEPVAPDIPAEPAASLLRQAVLSIPDPQFSEEESALPRRWMEQDIPRIDQAPDIQLPVNVSDDLVTDGTFDPAAVARWTSDPEAGTPDWLSVMAGRASPGDRSGSGPAVKAARASDPVYLDERPEDVSALQAIEEFLQVRIEGHRADDGFLYFALHVEPVSAHTLAVQPRDVLIVQDSSASMTPHKMDECRRGIKRWLDFLNAGDRFNILAFSDEINPSFPALRPYNPESRREAFQFIDRLRAVGNTDIFRSLQMALAMERDPNRTLLLVLITDGRPTVGMTGSSDIIEGITRGNQGQVAIFSVGGGPKVNSFFLDLLSYRNRGEALVVKGDEEIPRAMEAWAGQLQRPVLTDLSYRFSRIDPGEIYPKQLTHLFLDRPLVIHGRVPDGDEPLVFQVVGRAGATWHDFVFAIERGQIQEGPGALRVRWAWQKIYHLIGDYIGEAHPEKLEAIRSFADQFGLIVPYGFSRAMPRRM